MKSDYVSLWYTQFCKLRASKGSDLRIWLTPSYIEYIALTTAVPFNTGHPSAVSRSRQLKAALHAFSHYKVPLTFRYSWKRLRKRRSKNLIKFPQVYIAFVLQYVHCFEKKNTYWLNESWETRLPKRLKCTISYRSRVKKSKNFHLSPGQVHQNFYLSCYQITCPCQGKIDYQWIFYLSTGHWVKKYACPAWNSTCPGHQDKWFFTPAGIQMGNLQY